MEADAPVAPALTVGYGASSGEYTADKLAELRKQQPFQLRTKPAKPAVGRVTIEVPEPGQTRGCIPPHSTVDPPQNLHQPVAPRVMAHLRWLFCH
jgi:hypothetical protein